MQQSPGAAISKYRITFGGTKSVTIAYNAVVETDPISAALLPGARVWFTQWYKCDNPATGLPYGANLYFKEFEGPATESNDGSLVGAVGSLTDHTVSGGFNHVNNSLNLRDYVARGYHPMCVTGYPHPSYTGPGIAPFFVGDSITAFFDDLGEDGTQWAMRGWQGKFCKDIYPYVSYGIPSGTSGAFVTNFSRSNTFKYLLGVSGGATRVVTHMVNTYGINEIRFTYDAALTWRNRLDIAAIAHDYGISYIHSTLTPCGSRMVYASEKPGVITAFVAARKAFNDQVRAQSDDAHIPGCIGFIDPDTLLEVDYINSNNVWTDGSFEDPQATAIHPNPPGHKRYAAKIAASLFTNHPNPVPRPSR